jgi:glycosyltransferase involved in cell wall biosynthesis
MQPSYPQQWSGLTTVLSHDWLTGMRGGERVLEVLCRGFPRAPIFTLLHNPAAVSGIINSHPIVASPLQRVPGIARRYRHFLPFFPAAVAALRPPPCDLVISASHCVAKGIRPPPGARHLCYCFTPMRYAWTFHEEYFGRNHAQAFLARPILAALRRWDRRASRRVDRFVAISRHVQKRIRDFYGRDSDVVYPPVDTQRWTPGGPASGAFDLMVSALVPYKRIDLAVTAYTRLGFPLKIVGTGSELQHLRPLAGRNVEFLGWRPDEDILPLYRNCRLLVFPGEEDFGIVPLEAQACGRPVVAYARGGAMETVAPGVSGVFFERQTADALLDAVRTCASRRWDSGAIRANAERFDTQSFINGLAASIDRCLDSSLRH